VKQLAPPSGQLPPQQVALRTGGGVELAAWAARAAGRHLNAHPEELERYGVHLADWCTHDLQWLGMWAVLDADGQPVDFPAQLDWLARVLAARDYPLSSLADALETLADETPQGLDDAAAALRAGAERLRPPTL
jgi:hypothetical protein